MPVWPERPIGKARVRRLLNESYYLRIVTLLRRGLVDEEALGQAMADEELGGFCQTMRALENARARRALMSKWVLGVENGQIDETLFKTARIEGLEYREDNPNFVFSVVIDGYSVDAANLDQFCLDRLGNAYAMDVLLSRGRVALSGLAKWAQDRIASELSALEAQWGERNLVGNP